MMRGANESDNALPAWGSGCPESDEADPVCREGRLQTSFADWGALCKGDRNIANPYVIHKGWACTYPSATTCRS